MEFIREAMFFGKMVEVGMIRCIFWMIIIFFVSFTLWMS